MTEGERYFKAMLESDVSGKSWDGKASEGEHQSDDLDDDQLMPFAGHSFLTAEPSNLSDGGIATAITLATAPIAKVDADRVGLSGPKTNPSNSATNNIDNKSNELDLDTTVTAPEARPELLTVHESEGFNLASNESNRIMLAETDHKLQQRELFASSPEQVLSSSRGLHSDTKKEIRQACKRSAPFVRSKSYPPAFGSNALFRTESPDRLLFLPQQRPLLAHRHQQPYSPPSDFVSSSTKARPNILSKSYSEKGSLRQALSLGTETGTSPATSGLYLTATPNVSVTPCFPQSSDHRSQATDSSPLRYAVDSMPVQPLPSARIGSGSSGTGERGDQTNTVALAPKLMQPFITQQSTPPMNIGMTFTASPNEVSANIPREYNEIVERSPKARYLRFSEKLGSGAYKTVYRAYDTIEGIEVAWNVVNLCGVPRNERSRIVNEVCLLERLHHSNIISFHGSWVNRELEQVIFVTEILSSGTLKMFINKVQVIRWRIAKRWAIQILKGLEYLHSQDPPIIHRDLKCDNIFINGTSGDLRIGDLGLSTVISNRSKALSVLGTPEFMAPELYDEVYDEKVDIYAFGMCLLEIFTKEIPYRECSNPAQIYKKVIHGIPPQSLTRIRNVDARNFITLCLGTGNGTKGYYRPSASELLQHSFLAKQVDDDSEVEVDPPMSECAVLETQGPNEECATTSASYRGPSERDKMRGDGSLPLVAFSGSPSQSMTSAPVGGKQGGFSSHIANSSSALANVDTKNDPSSKKTPAYAQQYYSIPTDQGVGVIVAQLQVTTHDYHQHTGHDDGFNDMPETENNIKKVKVLMGRGQEIEDDDDFGHPMSAHTSLTTPARAAVAPVRIDANLGLKNDDVLNHGTQTTQRSGLFQEIMSTENSLSKPSEKQYLVFAAVMEENGETNPYIDDIMKLIITLPVEGQTQNVQFDFHLVEDDAIQVAREMVTELHIPVDAVLEISETISGLARSARIRQGNYKAHQQQSTNQQHVIQPPGLFVPHHSVSGDLAMKRHTVLGPNGNNIQAFAANFENDMVHNTDVSALVYQSCGGAVTPSHFTPIGDIPEALPQAAAAAVQSHLHAQHLLGEQPLPAALKVPEQVSILPTKSSDVLTHGPEAATLEHELFLVNPSIQKSCQQGSSLAQQSSNACAPEHVAATTRCAISKSLEAITDQLVKENTEDDNGCLSDASGDSNSLELRRLKEDYKKNLSRAQKAFLTRMDNMHRSKEVKEAEHLKTLEKHEKEKAEFEKRLKLAEEEQNRRLKLLEKEWATKLENAKRSSKQVGAKRDLVSTTLPLLVDDDNVRTITNNHQRLTFGDCDNVVSIPSMNSAAGVLETFVVEDAKRSGKAASVLPSGDGLTGD